MRQTILTRNDEGFDSIAWALEVHCKSENDARLTIAILTGNEDAPERIDFYEENDYRTKPVRIFIGAQS